MPRQTYEDLVDQYKKELLNDKKFMDQLEERFEKRLADESREKENKVQ